MYTQPSNSKTPNHLYFSLLHSIPFFPFPFIGDGAHELANIELFVNEGSGLGRCACIVVVAPGNLLGSHSGPEIQGRQCRVYVTGAVPVARTWRR
jgi:hypothetical protein